MLNETPKNLTEDGQAIWRARLGSIDAYRGLAMLLMVAEVTHLCAVAAHFPDSSFWGFACFHQSHVPWVGCSLHDLIQPSFTFLVGVALPFSIASRRRRGQSVRRMTVHAFYRALALIFLGIFLRSVGKSQTYYTFEDTLTQIGLGYGFLFLLGLRSTRIQWLAFATILVGTWLLFAAYPLPPRDFDYESVGVPADWENLEEGFRAHWNKNVNVAADFDRWFLNRFPREAAFKFNSGGYQTLNFIPTLATMILGLLAGGLLKREGPGMFVIARLAALGLLFLAAGWGLELLSICPLVKRIWTPSFVLFSGGWCLLTLSLFCWIIDLKQVRGWAFPLIVIGMNSIAIYCMSWTMTKFAETAIQTHLGSGFTQIFGEAYESLVIGVTITAIFWLTMFWMYRHRVFLKI